MHAMASPQSPWYTNPTHIFSGIVVAAILYIAIQRPAQFETRLRNIEVSIATMRSQLGVIAQWEIPPPQQKQFNLHIERRLEQVDNELSTRIAVLQAQLDRAVDRLHRFLQRSDRPEYLEPPERAIP